MNLVIAFCASVLQGYWNSGSKNTMLFRRIKSSFRQIVNLHGDKSSKNSHDESCILVHMNLIKKHNIILDYTEIISILSLEWQIYSGGQGKHPDSISCIGTTKLCRLRYYIFTFHRYSFVYTTRARSGCTTNGELRNEL